MKNSFLIAIMTIIASFQAHAQSSQYNGVLSVTAIYQNGTTAAVNCASGSVDITNIKSVRIQFLEPYGLRLLECLKSSTNASDLTSACATVNQVQNVLSGPEGWQEFSNPAGGYLWQQDYPASQLAIGVNYKMGIRVALVPGESPVNNCQFVTVGTQTTAQVQPFNIASTVQFKNIAEYVQLHNVNQTQTRASCAANEPKGNINCWSDMEKATFFPCLGVYDSDELAIIMGGGEINESIGILYNSQPLYQWYRANNPQICVNYVPSPIIAPEPIVTPVVPVATPVVAPVVAPVVTPVVAPAPVVAPVKVPVVAPVVAPPKPVVAPVTAPVSKSSSSLASRLKKFLSQF